MVSVLLAANKIARSYLTSRGTTRDNFVYWYWLISVLDNVKISVIKSIMDIRDVRFVHFENMQVVMPHHYCMFSKCHHGLIESSPVLLLFLLFLHPSPNTTPHLQPLTGPHLASPVVKCLFSNICILHAVNALLLPESPAIFFFFFFCLAACQEVPSFAGRCRGPCARDAFAPPFMTPLQLLCLHKEARLEAVTVNLHPAHIQASFWNKSLISFGFTNASLPSLCSTLCTVNTRVGVGWWITIGILCWHPLSALILSRFGQSR